MKFNPADNIQDLQYFGEFGGVNPSISDSLHLSFRQKLCLIPLKAIWKVVIYILAIPPSNLYLDRAMAAMEGTETANVSASGMGAITPTLMQLCGAGDHIVSSRTIYGGTYAF
jgi:methionine-gamma-lyase